MAAGLYHWPLALEDARVAARLLGQGVAVMPPKVYLRVHDARSWTGYFGGLAGLKGRSLIKWLTYFSGTQYGPPAIEGLLVLSDIASGRPLAIMQAGSLTAVRTAATTVLAIHYLAMPGASTVAMLGAGVQVRHHAYALAALCPSIQRFVFWSRTSSRLDTLAEALQPALHARVVVAKSAQDAIRGADIIVCAMSADAPVLKADWLPRNALVVDIGENSFEPEAAGRFRHVVLDWKGRDTELVSRGLGRAIKAGLYAKDSVTGDLSEFVLNKITHVCPSEGLVLFDSVGLAVEDLVLASRLYDEAAKMGIGRHWSLAMGVTPNSASSS